MKTAGIVAEYNPFHRGHEYQIETLRAQGFDGIVVAMSGNFVQRAEPAIIDKYTRAQAAVCCGVDLVLELPLPYAVASGEDFAAGGIGVLAATGIVDVICCGGESGEEHNRKQYEDLRRAEASGEVKKQLKAGLSYPAACKAAVLAQGGTWSDGANDILALSYRKALQNLASEIPLQVLPRKGSYHGTQADDGFESAESIRRRLRAGEGIESALPPASYRLLKQAQISDLLRIERGILAYYRRAIPQQLKAFYGMMEGLPERICNAADAPSLEELYRRTKTKRFPLSAVRRAVLSGYLGIPASLPELTYLRVLAFNDRGQELLREMKRRSTLPAVSGLTPQMRKDPLAEIQLQGDEIFALTTPCVGSRYRDLTESARKTDGNL